MRTHIATKIALGLSFLIMGIVCLSGTLGLMPDETAAINHHRAGVCEMFAVQCATALTHNDFDSMRDLTATIAERNPDILTLAVRDSAGKLVSAAGPHEALWAQSKTDSSIIHVDVPIYLNDKQWGQVEFTFHPAASNPFLGSLLNTQGQLILFISLASLLGIMFMLRRVLQHLDPSTVIPDRVKALLDTLAEGVIVLDPKQRVVVANNAFAAATGVSGELLVGKDLSNIPWKQTDGTAPSVLPWNTAARSGENQRNATLMLESKATGQRIFSTNSSIITGGGTTARGVLVSLDDVTDLHDRNTKLVTMIKDLEAAQETVRQQNAQLSVMAMKDALTGCFNRRAMFDKMAGIWADAKRHSHPVSIVMVDVDHFKSVNDKHGHKTGDQVLQRVAQTLNQAAREVDTVCRYGGEEFCVLLPHADADQAVAAAERLRSMIESLQIGELKVTASFGVATTINGEIASEKLLESADGALYAAKRTGRNRVIHAERMPANVPPPEPRRKTEEAAPSEPGIPFPAVTALFTALQHRDLSTAAHSRRVADLCVAVAGGLMPTQDVLVLEVAALLHDVGKIGVPDSILLKPGPLTQEEFEVMDRHSFIGIEIVQAAFKSAQLSQIVRTHHAHYGGNPRQPNLPTGEAIPLGSRILCIADAYDAIVSDRIYRKGRSPEHAFAELRSCAGSQFDPQLVERFIATAAAGHHCFEPVPQRDHWSQLSREAERLGNAVGAKDIASVTAVAQHMGQVALKLEVPDIAELAAKITQASDVEQDAAELLRLTNEMLDLCASAQNRIIAESSVPRENAAP